MRPKTQVQEGVCKESKERGPRGEICRPKQLLALANYFLKCSPEEDGFGSSIGISDGRNRLRLFRLCLFRP